MTDDRNPLAGRSRPARRSARQPNDEPGCQQFRERYDRVLAYRIRRSANLHEQARGRGCAHEVAVAALEPARNYQGRRPDMRAYVHVENMVPIVI